MCRQKRPEGILFPFLQLPAYSSPSSCFPPQHQSSSFIFTALVLEFPMLPLSASDQQYHLQYYQAYPKLPSELPSAMLHKACETKHRSLEKEWKPAANALCALWNVHSLISTLSSFSLFVSSFSRHVMTWTELHKHGHEHAGSSWQKTAKQWQQSLNFEFSTPHYNTGHNSLLPRNRQRNGLHFPFSPFPGAPVDHATPMSHKNAGSNMWSHNAFSRDKVSNHSQVTV